MSDRDSLIKLHGVIEQQQKGFSGVRVRTVAGNLTSAQLRSLADLAERYGDGQLHITTRQSVELHWVPEDKLNSICHEIIDAGLLLAVRGPRVLTAIACPGIALCKRGLCDTKKLAAQVDALLVGREQPGKTKIALSGCPNSCAKPHINDIGLHGAAAGERRGYAVYIGGKAGKEQTLGHKIFTIVPEEEAITSIEAILAAYSRMAQKGERISDVISRVGLAGVKEEIWQSAAGVTGKTHQSAE